MSSRKTSKSSLKSVALVGCKILDKDIPEDWSTSMKNAAQKALAKGHNFLYAAECAFDKQNYLVKSFDLASWDKYHEFFAFLDSKNLVYHIWLIYDMKIAYRVEMQRI